MILMSPSHGIAQTVSVTTTFDAGRITRAGGLGRPQGGPQGGGVDWDRVETLYSFCRARARDGVQAAELRHDSLSSANEQHCLHTLEAMYAQARHRSDVVAVCAVTYFRARAMRDAQHADFLGEWIATPRTPKSSPGARV